MNEPNIRPDAAKKYKKKNKDEFKSRILKFLNQFKTMKEENEMRASELELLKRLMTQNYIEDRYNQS